MIIVEGVIEDIIFTNEANGYTVCEIVNSKRNVTHNEVICLLLTRRNFKGHRDLGYSS